MIYFYRSGRDVDQCAGNVESIVDDIVSFLIPEDPLSDNARKELAHMIKTAEDELSSMCDMFNVKQEECDAKDEEINRLESQISDLQDTIEQFKERIEELEHELAPWRVLNI